MTFVEFVDKNWNAIGPAAWIVVLTSIVMAFVVLLAWMDRR